MSIKNIDKYSLIGFIGLIALVFVIALTSGNSSNQSESQDQQVQQKDISATSEMVKLVDSKCRYFFSVKNNTDSNFNGLVEIELLNQSGKSVWHDSFDFSRSANTAASVYTDANTCPSSVHGEYGISDYQFSVKENGQTVNSGSAPISEQFE